MTRRRLIVAAAFVVLVAAGVLLWLRLAPRAVTVTAGKFPEQLVYVRAKDDVINAGALFTAPKGAEKPIGVIWIHGWGVNFYSPTYTNIGRALAARGYTTITANTRMHDLANVEGERMGKRIRGGGYWGVGSDQTRDIAAWIDFAESLGFKNVILVGHSAGWYAVRAYEAQTADPRVIGLIAASGQVYPNDPPDPKILTQSEQLVAAKRGDELLQLPRRSYPSYVSADTFLDIARSPTDLQDFYGIRTSTPGIGRVHCPILAWFGTGDDVGSAKDLEKVKTSVARLESRHTRLDTVLIANADHMYTGKEQQIAETIAKWATTLKALRVGP